MSKEKPARYVISSELLPTGYLESIMKTTLDMYLGHQDISNSPFVRWGRETLAEDKWWYAVGKLPIAEREAGIQERQQKVIDLYHNIRDEGYNGSDISIFFDKTGQVHTYDGFHRLCILKYLGRVVDCNTVISYHDPNPASRGDFPLEDMLIEVNGGKKNLYQPINLEDGRLADFHLWNHDSPQRLKFLKKNLVGKTVLDIGCSEGWMSRALAREGYEVTALDNDHRRVAITRYLAIINNLQMDYVQNSWQNHIKRDVRYDNILLLSVFHHDIISRGPDNAFNSLQFFIDKADKVFFESAVTSKMISWLPPEKKDLFDYTEEEFKAKIEDKMRMTVTKTWYGKRPLFVLEA